MGKDINWTKECLHKPTSCRFKDVAKAVVNINLFLQEKVLIAVPAEDSGVNQSLPFIVQEKGVQRVEWQLKPGRICNTHFPERERVDIL